MATLLIGDESRGTSADFTLAGDIAGWELVAAASGDVKHIYVHTKVANAALSTLTVALYADNSGLPGTRLSAETSAALGAITSAIPGGTTSGGLIRYDLATPITVTSGTTYHLAIRAAGEQFDFQGDVSAGAYDEKAGGSLPNPWGAAGSAGGTHLTIFATDAPIAQVIAESVLADTAAGTSHSVPLPNPSGGILADDLLLIFVGQDSAAGGTHSYPDGTYVELLDTRDGTNAVNGGVAYRWMAGGETGNFTVTTSASEGGGIRCLLIRGADRNTNPVLASATGSSTNPNPPNLDPAGWATEPTLWIAMAANDGNVAITAAPTGFVDFANTRWANTNGAGVATAWRVENVGSLDPGTFTMATEQWVAATVAVRPAQLAANDFSGTSSVRAGANLSSVAAKQASAASTGRAGGRVTSTSAKQASGSSRVSAGGRVTGAGVAGGPAVTATSTVTAGPRAASTGAKAASGSSRVSVGARSAAVSAKQGFAAGSARAGARVTGTGVKDGRTVSVVSAAPRTTASGRKGAVTTSLARAGAAVASLVRKAVTAASAIVSGARVSSVGTSATPPPNINATSSVRAGGAARSSASKGAPASSTVRAGGNGRTSGAKASLVASTITGAGRMAATVTTARQGDSHARAGSQAASVARKGASTVSTVSAGAGTHTGATRLIVKLTLDVTLRHGLALHATLRGPALVLSARPAHTLDLEAGIQ